ncbi:MAG: hypothetical protein KME17_11640 [Cyanosarcina radialis HA8281-LM2]|jgi:hypothetical protein|nr:hypothetical protein [Cyanosarcina radialis HA8281-LM2]
MSTIVIKDLSLAGFEILIGEESYLDTLTETELNIAGGLVYSPYLEQLLSLRPTALTF